MWKASVSKKVYFDLSDLEVAGPSAPPAEDPPAGSPAPPPRPSLLLEEISSSETAEEDPLLKRLRRNRRCTPPFIISDASLPDKAFSFPEEATPRGSSPSKHSSPVHLLNSNADPDLPPASPKPVPAALKDLLGQLRDISEEELQNQPLSTVCELLNATLIRGLAHQREIARRLPGVTCNYQEIQRLKREHAIQLQTKDLEVQSLTTQLQATSLELQDANTELNYLRKEQETHKLQMENDRQELEALKKSSQQQAQESSQQIAILKTEESILREKLDAAQGELAAYHLSESGRWATRQQEYLASPEFNNMLEDRAAHALRWGFIGAVKQIQEAKCIPPGTSLDFLNIQKALSDMPDDAL